MAAAPAAMILVRLLENIYSSPVAVAINLSYCKPRWNSAEKAGWWPGDSATLDNGQGVSKKPARKSQGADGKVREERSEPLRFRLTSAGFPGRSLLAELTLRFGC